MAGVTVLGAQGPSVSTKKAAIPNISFSKVETEQAKNSGVQNPQNLRDVRAVNHILRPVACRDVAAGDIVDVARRKGIAPRILAAQIVVESSCRPTVVSKAGAVGLMQVMPSVWKKYSQVELLNPVRNMDIGSDILVQYVHQTGSYREGLRRYHGVTEGSDQADIYADKVLSLAGRK